MASPIKSEPLLCHHHHEGAPLRFPGQTFSITTMAWSTWKVTSGDRDAPQTDHRVVDKINTELHMLSPTLQICLLSRQEAHRNLMSAPSPPFYLGCRTQKPVGKVHEVADELIDG